MFFSAIEEPKMRINTKLLIHTRNTGYGF